MSKQDVIEVEGKVLEALPNAMFQVELEAVVLLFNECVVINSENPCNLRHYLFYLS